jgi:hypothetical protein
MDARPQDIIQELDDVLFEGRPQVRYTVMAVHEDRCWIQDREGQDEIVPLSACIRARSIH